MVESTFSQEREISSVFPTLPGTFYNNIFESLVYRPYAKLHDLARKLKLEHMFNSFTKNLNLSDIQKRIYELSNEMPERISIYEINLYTDEIWAIILGDNEEKLKNFVENMSSRVSEKELLSFNISKWNIVKTRLNNYSEEAIRTLLEEDLEYDERFKIITYIQGLGILGIVVDNFIKKALKKSDVMEGWKLGSQIILLSLITSKYLRGDLDPEDYLFDMEYAGEIFTEEQKGYPSTKIIEHLEYIANS